MKKALKFVSTLVSVEPKVSHSHMAYLQCKTAHGHFIDLFDHDNFRQILCPYIRYFDVPCPTKFDDIVNKIHGMKIPLNMEFIVRYYDDRFFSEARILPLETD